MSVTLISVSHDTVVSNKHEERTRHYYVNFQHTVLRQKKAQPPGIRLKHQKQEGRQGQEPRLVQIHTRNVFGQDMSLVQRLWNPGCEVRRSLSLMYQSGCAKDNNRYNILSMEEIEESKDCLDNKIISNSTLLSEGFPSGLTRDIKPGLNSSTKNKNIKEEIPKDTFICSV